MIPVSCAFLFLAPLMWKESKELLKICYNNKKLIIRESTSCGPSSRTYIASTFDKYFYAIQTRFISLSNMVIGSLLAAIYLKESSDSIIKIEEEIN